MNEASMVRCLGVKSVPLPLGDVFHIVAEYPILVTPTAGMSISVPMVLLVMFCGNCPEPELILNLREYSFAIHLGYSVRAVLWPK